MKTKLHGQVLLCSTGAMLLASYFRLLMLFSNVVLHETVQFGVIKVLSFSVYLFPQNKNPGVIFDTSGTDDKEVRSRVIPSDVRYILLTLLLR